MTHRTYRHLDSPVRLFGLTWGQWVLVVGCVALAWAVVNVLHPPTEVSLWLGTVLIGSPLALTYLSGDGSATLATQLVDVVRWTRRARRLPAPADAAALRATPLRIADEQLTTASDRR